MAFTVSNDHARQQQVWEAVSRSHNKEPYHIRRQLTEGAVRASDRRARFVGIDMYQAAGGVVARDLSMHPMQKRPRQGPGSLWRIDGSERSGGQIFQSFGI